MELSNAIRRRRMVRSFTDEPIDRSEVEQLLDLARRAPSAGNTQAVEFLVLTGADETAAYWDVTLPEPRRSHFRWQGLLAAPVLVVITTRPESYVARYAEDDKARAGLGEAIDGWPQPFWWIDAGMVAQNLLLSATDRSLGACLFGLFDHEAAVAERFGIPPDRRLVATIALGRPRGDDTPGRSARRPRPATDAVVSWGEWTPTAGADP